MFKKHLNTVSYFQKQNNANTFDDFSSCPASLSQCEDGYFPPTICAGFLPVLKLLIFSWAYFSSVLASKNY